MRTRTFIASLVTALALTGCSASAEESEGPDAVGNARSTSTATRSASAAPETPPTETSTPDVSVSEIPTEPAGPVRAKGWTGPEDGITITSDVTDKQGAEAAATAALTFLRKWTLREELMRTDLRAARAALAGVTAELGRPAAYETEQGLRMCAGPVPHSAAGLRTGPLPRLAVDRALEPAGPACRVAGRGSKNRPHPVGGAGGCSLSALSVSGSGRCSSS